MLSRIFITLCNLPGLRKKLWRSLYNYLARWRGTPDWTFMNYGYADDSTNTLQLADADENNRYWIQLYQHVAGAVDLTACTALEVGSGRGGGASFVKRYLHPARMIAVDLSKNAVDLCRKMHSVDGLEFKVGDAENLPVTSDSVDAVINVESSHCYPSFEKFLAEVHRVLRPGGHFVYADLRDRSYVETWRKQLQDSRLALVRETDITRNVVVALDHENERKVAFIDNVVPRFLRPAFNDFAGVRGSAVYEGFRNGRFVYMSFVLRKPLFDGERKDRQALARNTPCGKTNVKM